MQFTDIKPGIIGLTTSFGASICCVLPMTIVLLGLGSGGFMMVTMQYRIILYPLGLMGLVTRLLYPSAAAADTPCVDLVSPGIAEKNIKTNIQHTCI